MPSCRQLYATAMPALMPEDEMSRFLPMRMWSSQSAPMPRSLNEPEGCKAYSVSQTSLWLNRLSGCERTIGI